MYDKYNLAYCPYPNFATYHVYLERMWPINTSRAQAYIADDDFEKALENLASFQKKQKT